MEAGSGATGARKSCINTVGPTVVGNLKYYSIDVLITTQLQLFGTMPYVVSVEVIMIGFFL